MDPLYHRNSSFVLSLNNLLIPLYDRQAIIDRYSPPNSDRLIFLLTTRRWVVPDTVTLFDSG